MWDGLSGRASWCLWRCQHHFMGKSSILLLSVYCRSNSEQQSCTDVNIKAELYNFPHLPCCDGESCFGRLCTSWWCKSATGNMKIGAASVSLRMLILHVKRRARCKMCEFQLLTFFLSRRCLIYLKGIWIHFLHFFLFSFLQLLFIMFFISLFQLCWYERGKLSLYVLHWFFFQNVGVN